ncbi:MAG: primosomal replication protein N [Comamonas sp.]|nr:primosomal replication protein N [Comamonas sp.]
MENRLVLSACITERAPMRFTPAGVPALDLRLLHQSQQMEAGSTRTVQASIKAIAFGALAEKLARQAPESCWRFQGFLASPRNSKSVVFHIQDMQQD